MNQAKRNVPEFQPPQSKIIEAANTSFNEITKPKIEEINILTKYFFKDFFIYYIYEINFPKSSQLHQIEYNSFSYLHLYSITFPPSLSIILPEALKDCKNLNEIKFMKNDANKCSLKYICDEAFRDTIINSIILPESIEEIGSHSFPSCISSIEFENGAQKLQNVSDSAFSETQLGTIKIPTNTSLFINQKNIFYKCKKLKTIIFDSSLIDEDIFALNVIEEERELKEKRNRKMKFNEFIQKDNKKVTKNNYTYSDVSQDLARSLLLSQTKVENLEVLYSNLNYFYFFNTPKLNTITVPKSDNSRYIKINGCLYTNDRKKLIVAERNIKEVKIESDCEIISNYALNISCLEKVSIEKDSKLKEISFLAFYDSKLKGIDLPNRVDLIDYAAFYNCKKLESLEIPQSMNFIDFFTFSYTNLTTVVIPKNVIKIEFGSFLCCFNLEKVSFEKQSKLIEIDDYAFACTKIQSISIPTNVKRIGNFCFFNCHQLESIEFEDDSNINEIGSNCFKNTKIEYEKLSKILLKIDFSIKRNENNKIYFIKPNLFENITQIFIPSNVEEIGFNAFFQCTTLQKVEIIDFPNSKLTTIQNSAFYNCTSLVEFKIPESVCYFGHYSFYNCMNYKAIISVNSEKEIIISKKAFENSGLISFNLNAEYIKVFNYAFKNCPNLNVFTVSATKHCEFGNSVFMNCSSLKNCEINQKVNYIKIGKKCFENSSIQKFVVPEKLLLIPMKCFKSCKNLKELSINDNSNLRKIDIEAFYESRIESIFIPKGTEIIGKSCFEKCQKLKQLVFSDKLYLCIIKKNAFFGSGIVNISIPKGISKICYGCFENCTNLTKVFFDSYKSLYSISKNAFKSTGIEYINLPKSVQLIKKSAFENCTKLKEVTFEYKSKLKSMKIYYSSFSGCNQIQKIISNSSVEIFDKSIKNYSNCIRIARGGMNQNRVKSLIVNSEKIFPFQQCYYFYNFNYTIKDVETDEKIDYVCNNSNIVKKIDGVYYSMDKKKILFSDFETNYVSIPKETKNIKAYSFAFSHLTKVDFGSGSNLKTIGKHAFQNLLIEEISIPDTVLKIGDFAFSGCSKLKTVNITQNSCLKTIGVCAFERTLIESILLPSTLRLINNSAFEQCLQLKKVDMFSNQLIFGSHSFYRSSIEQINFPSNSTFEVSSFKECLKLKQLYFTGKPEHIIFNIESFAMSGIERIDLDCDVTINENAFIFCPNLKQVKLKGNDIRCCSSAFDYSSITEFSIQLKTELDRYDPNDYSNLIANRILNSYVKKFSMDISITTTDDSNVYNNKFFFDNNCFVDDNQLTYVNLIDNDDEILYVPDTVKTLCFQPVTHLKKIVWPSNCIVDDLGSTGFFSYYNLVEITIPKLVTFISPRLFEHCHYLKVVQFEEGSLLREIGEFSFSNTKISEINLPNSVFSINEYAFSKNKNLKSVTFNGEIIKKGAFMETGIIEFTLSNNTRTIESNAFQYCKNLTKFNIDIDNSNLSEIGEFAFAGTSINEINIPPEVQNIKKSTFNNCIFLREVKISSNSKLNKINEYAFAGNLSLEKINIPKSIIKLSSKAFINTPSLLSIMPQSNINFFVNKNVVYFNHELFFVPRNLKTFQVDQNCSTIKSSAFCGPNLEEVLFPDDSLKCIEECAFAHSTALREIVLPESLQKIECDAFIHCENLEVVEFKQNCQLKVIPRFCFAFSGLKIINLPSSIEIIDDSSFYFCLNLRKINLFRTNVKYIGDSAFFCTSIDEIIFPSTIEYIENHAFEQTKMLKLVDFSHCHKIKDFSNTFDKPKKLIKFIKKIKSCSKQIELRNVKAQAPFQTPLISKTKIPAIIRPNLSQTSSPKKGFLNKSTAKLPPHQFQRHRTMLDFKTENNQIKTNSKSTTCLIKESSFSNSSVEVFIFNHKKFKWFDFFDKCENIKEYIVNSNINLLLFKKAKVNPFKQLIGSYYRTKKLNMKIDFIPFEKQLLSPFHFLTSSQLTKIILTDDIKIKTIQKCFSFTKIKEITIPSSVLKIKRCAFKSCYELEKVTFLPKSLLKTIENFAFYECKKLNNISIPDKVKVIPMKCFSFSGLNSIELPNSIEKIEEMAFFNCTKLNKIKLNEGIQKIGVSSFANNYSLEIINLPDSLKSLEKHSFANCFNLMQVNTTPNTQLVSIQNGCFENTQIAELKLNPEIKCFSVPLGVSKLNKISFYKGKQTKFTQFEDGTIYECISTNKKNDNKTINENIEEINETLILLNSIQKIYKLSDEIAQAAEKCYKLIFVPKNMKILKIHEFCVGFDDYVFDSMQSLTTIEYEKRSTNIIFNLYNKSIKHIKIFPNYVHLSRLSSYDNNSLETFEFGKSTNIFIIPSSFFLNCTNLKSIVIPCSCRAIDRYAFKNCINLTSVKFVELKQSQNGIVSIFHEAFYNCCSLLEIEIPSSIKAIYSKAFMNCTKLTRVVMKKPTIEINEDDFSFYSFQIDQYAFANCTSLVSFESYILCTEIGASSFMNCTNLKTFLFNGKRIVQIGNRAFYNCSSLVKFELNDLIYENFIINSEAFMNCTALEEINIKCIEITKRKILRNYFSHKKQIVGLRAFYNCKSLKKIALLTGICKEIHEEAFANCSSLELLEIKQRNQINQLSEFIHYKSFINVPNSIIIRVRNENDVLNSLTIKDIQQLHKVGKRIIEDNLSHLNKSFLS